MNQIATPLAPRALGPYSQAVTVGGTVYLSGQLGLVPDTGKLAGDDSLEAQLNQAFLNIAAILSAGSSGLDKVVKTTVYLSHLAEDFPEMNKIYATKFTSSSSCPPARSTVGVQCLPAGARVMIDVIAIQSVAFTSPLTSSSSSTANRVGVPVAGPGDDASKVVVVSAVP